MQTAFAPAGQAPLPAKPQGGYRIITAALLAAAWWVYRKKLIRLVDLRVWFATHEMDARRCRVEHDGTSRFNLRELQRLTGLSIKRLRDSLRRLQAARLVSWSETALGFPESTNVLPGADTDEFRAFLGQIPNPERKVPVPRRTLRLLAGGARPALIATVLGHLIRGLYLKFGKCHDRGRVKASWIADVFGISIRRVKHARQELIASGWLIPLNADQWALNRWGVHFRINLEWSRRDATSFRVPNVQTPQISGPVLPALGPKSAPPPAAAGPELAPPDSYEEPLIGRQKNQKPASGPAGISISHPGKKAVVSQAVARLDGRTLPPTLASLPAPAPVASPTIPPAPFPEKCGSSSSVPSRTQPASVDKPNLRDVVPEDLKDTGRLLDLYDQAIALGYVTTSERDRLRFVAAAEHARVIGTKNPCGLFVRLVRCGLWTFLTQDDEDAANVRLKSHLFGKIAEQPVTRITPMQNVEFLSEDAVVVRAVRAAVAHAGYRGDAFPVLRRERPEWTRARWDAALAELEPAPGCGCR